MTVKNRIEWIDILKGFLLMCICFSHFGYLPDAVRILTYGTGNVWVPSFFFISGLLFSSKRHPRLKDYVISKTKTLLIPYLFFFLVFVILDWNLYIKPEVVFQADFNAFIYGDGPNKAAPLWFIAKLFWISIIYYIVQQQFLSTKYRFTVILIFGAAGYSLYYFDIHLPLGLDIISSSIVFFGLGHLLKKQIYQFVALIEKQYLIIGLFIVIGLGIISRTASINNPNSILGQNTIHNFALFYLSAASGILAIIAFISMLYHKLSTFFITRSFFSIFIYIAKNALPILIIHCYILILIDSFFKIINFQDAMLIFLAKVSILIPSFYLIIVPFINSKLYLLLGKEKITWIKSIKG